MLVTKNSKKIPEVKPTTIMRLPRVMAGCLPRPIKNTLKQNMGVNKAAPSLSDSSACETKKLSA
jgi:hypothetical protein